MERIMDSIRAVFILISFSECTISSMRYNCEDILQKLAFYLQCCLLRSETSSKPQTRFYSFRPRPAAKQTGDLLSAPNFNAVRSKVLVFIYTFPYFQISLKFSCHCLLVSSLRAPFKSSLIWDGRHIYVSIV